ncbi:MAG: nodulation protein NfeD [Chlorobiaceae bacterium]|nr:nodulation protein NfeD [Chlorobiaceae bacterium]NTW74305.1 nodulation protein NfeD [Chlorobiaceae bacterium]
MQAQTVGRLRAGILAMVTLVVWNLVSANAFGTSREIRAMVLKGSVNPGSAAYFRRVLDESNRAGDRLLLVELDTPGGLVSSMRSMIQGVMASRVPVVVYVSPSGAQAASAGALLLLSSHVAVMAPGTETGAAHPVGLGGGSEERGSVMAKKVENDLAAFARSLAEKRGRSTEWAERSVRESIASTSSEALRAGVIDTVASSRRDLLEWLDGRRVSTAAGTLIIHTSGLVVREAGPSFPERVMMVIADPSIASILILVGLAGLYFELSTPGAVFPGVAGAISLLLGLYAVQLLSGSATGLMLILLAVLFLGLELVVTSGGVLAVAGLVALFIGSLMSFNVPEKGLFINWLLFLPVFLSFSAGVLLLVFVVARSTRRRSLTGSEGLIGERGRVVKSIGPGLPRKVYVHGELWDASGMESCQDGAPVAVTGIEGMKLKVKPIKEP